MTLNIHYKHLQDPTKETIRPLVEQKIEDVLRIFGEALDPDQAVSQVHIEHLEKKDSFEVRAHIKVRRYGKEINLTAGAEGKDLPACVDTVKNELQAQARKEKR